MSGSGGGKEGMEVTEELRAQTLHSKHFLQKAHKTEKETMPYHHSTIPWTII